MSAVRVTNSNHIRHSLFNRLRSQWGVKNEKQNIAQIQCSVFHCNAQTWLVCYAYGIHTHFILQTVNMG